MPQGFRNLEWLNHNENRHYPLAADASLRDISGSFALPEDFITAMYLPVHWDNNIQPGNFFLYKLLVSETGFRITIGYAGSGGDVEIAAASVPRNIHSRGRGYILTGLGDFFDSRGWIQLGSLDNIDEQPAGEFIFDIGGGRLEPDVVRPNLRNVVSMQIQNGTELSREMTGFVRLRGGRNTRLTTLTEDGQPVVVLDAISGVGLKEDCPCSDELPPPIRSINSVVGDSGRNITLLTNHCLEVEAAGDHSLLVKNICADPCCGCKELRPIVEALELIGSKHTTFENFIVNLEARVTNADQIFLASRLGDRGCSPATECP
jgi:hypothetical protein